MSDDKQMIDCEGGCECGAIRYHIKGPLLNAEYCHCGQCRRISGGPSALWADYNSADVTWLRRSPAYFASSEFGRRGFCPDCGSTLVWLSVRKPEHITLSITSLDDPNQIAPQKHIYTKDKLHWLEIKDGLPQE